MSDVINNQQACYDKVMVDLFCFITHETENTAFLAGTLSDCSHDPVTARTPPVRGWIPPLSGCYHPLGFVIIWPRLAWGDEHPIQHIRDADPMLAWHWASCAGPMSRQHWINISCMTLCCALLGSASIWTWNIGPAPTIIGQPLWRCSSVGPLQDPRRMPHNDKWLVA